MKNNKQLFAFLLLMTCLVACNNTDDQTSDKSSEVSKTETTENELNNYISMFEIPATDISRAIRFYEALLDAKIEKMKVEGMEMGVLPYEQQQVTGVIMKGEGYTPSADGVTIYLNGGEDLQLMLNKVEKNGGKILFPKTAHADGSGFFAIFLDSEGNKMGLNSPH